MTLRIRLATADDAAGLARVQAESWRVAYRGLLPHRILDALTHERASEDMTAALGRDGTSGVRVIVADADGVIAGYARWGPIRRTRGDVTDATAELYDLYVLPERFGSGLGAGLTRAVLEQMRRHGHRVAALWVLRGNMRARRFYERGGWVADGAERRSETAPGIPSVRYRRTIA